MRTQQKKQTSWGGVSNWYSDLVGEKGQYFHQKLIIPKLIQILKLKKEDSLLDLGCGEGVFERSIPTETNYLGIDVAESLVREAKKKSRTDHHRFHLANLSRPIKIQDQFTAAVCILALQNMEHGEQCVKTAGQLLKPKAKFAIVLNHPSFRIPRQSSWGFDEKNKLQFRKVNRYLSPLEIPIQMNPGKTQGKMTWSFHHPLSTYFSWLKSAGFVVEDCQEWASGKESEGKAAKMENRARSEFPMFLCLVARKI